MDHNCLSYWFPKIRDAGLPVPRTEIVETTCELVLLLDGETPRGWGEFCQQLDKAAERVGYPCFLRTGHTSNKHDWERTCYLTAPEDIGQHVFNLEEFSACCDPVGLPTEVWAVRELIPTAPAFHAFRGMPITREFRLFTDAGKVSCIHPYWPPDVIRQPTVDDWEKRLLDISRIDVATDQELRGLAEHAARAVDGGSWSADFLQSATGNWWLTDMAEAERSWHWPECEEADG